MNQEIDISFLLPSSGMFPEIIYASNRFEYLFLEAKEAFFLGDLEQTKYYMDRYFEKMYLSDFASFFWYSESLKETELEKLSSFYFQLGEFAQSMTRVQDDDFLQQYLKIFLSFLKNGITEPLLLSVIYSLSPEEKLPEMFFSSEKTSFLLSLFLKQVEQKKIKKHTYISLLTQDFFFKPLVLEILGRELKYKQYLYQSLEYEDISMASNGAYVSTYANSLNSLIRISEDSSEKLFYLITLTLFEDRGITTFEIVEGIFFLEQKKERKKVFHFLGPEYFGGKFYDFLQSVEDIDADVIDISHIAHTYIDFVNNKPFHQYFTNKIFFSFVYRYLSQHLEQIDAQYKSIIETLTRHNLISIFQKYDRQKILFLKSKYAKKQAARFFFDKLSTFLTFIMFVLLLFGIGTVFLMIFMNV